MSHRNARRSSQARKLLVQPQLLPFEKERDEEAFAVKQATLDKLQVTARDGQQCRLFYLDKAGICAAPLVQRSWSPRGLPPCR